MAFSPTHGHTPNEPRPEEGQDQAHTLGGRLDLNHASIEQIMAAANVDRETAQKILRFRDERGGFETWADFDEIPIDEECRARLRPHVRL